LAQHVFSLYSATGTGHVPLTTLVWPRLPNLAEHLTRDWERPDHGEIVCHCELVTRREIDEALTGPLPATDLGGLKRRTRVTMGRCQGFYCSARLAELTAGRLAEPLAVGPCHD
jgi:glycerol-3-phosphate dehydrogenase